MKTLTEDEVKKAAISFLKGYYRHIPRVGDMRVEFDKRGENGVIVDGHLSFRLAKDESTYHRSTLDADYNDIVQDNDTATFDAVVEATSYSKAAEVQYRPNLQRIWWDALAFASISSFIYFLLEYELSDIDLRQLGMVYVVLITAANMLLAGLLYHLWARRRSFYRQIYAIEQFQLYHADHYWIAIDHDVFPRPSDDRTVQSRGDRQLTELQKQIIRHGYGLIMVDGELKAHLLISPSRDAIRVRKPRRQIALPSFVSQFDLNTTLYRSRNRIWQLPLIRRLRRHRYAVESSVDWQRQARFARHYYGQLTVISVCFVALSVLLWRAFEQPLVRVGDMETYRREMQQHSEQLVSPEPDLQDTGDYYLTYITPTDSQLVAVSQRPAAYTPQEWAQILRWRQEGSASDTLFNGPDNPVDEPHERARLTDIPTPTPASPAAPQRPPGSRAPTSAPSPLQDDCGAYRAFDRPVYVVQEGVYATRDNAERRAIELRKLGLSVRTTYLGCFRDVPPYFVVHVGRFYNTRASALTAQNEARRTAPTLGTTLLLRELQAIQ